VQLVVTTPKWHILYQIDVIPDHCGLAATVAAYALLRRAGNGLLCAGKIGAASGGKDAYTGLAILAKLRCTGWQGVVEFDPECTDSSLGSSARSDE